MLTKEPARSDLTSRECAKLICGLLGGIVSMLDDEDSEQLRQSLQALAEAKLYETGWEDSVPLRMSVRAMGALIGALKLFVKEDPKELQIALKWVVETDAVWERLK